MLKHLGMCSYVIGNIKELLSGYLRRLESTNGICGASKVVILLQQYRCRSEKYAEDLPRLALVSCLGPVAAVLAIPQNSESNTFIAFRSLHLLAHRSINISPDHRRTRTSSSVATFLYNRTR